MKGGSYSRGGGFTRQGVKHRKAPVNEVFFSKFFIIIRIPRVIWRGIRNYLSYFSGHWERIQSPVPVTPMDVRMCVGALGNLVSFSQRTRGEIDLTSHSTSLQIKRRSLVLRSASCGVFDGSLSLVVLSILGVEIAIGGIFNGSILEIAVVAGHCRLVLGSRLVGYLTVRSLRLWLVGIGRLVTVEAGCSTAFSKIHSALDAGFDAKTRGSSHDATTLPNRVWI